LKQVSADLNAGKGTAGRLLKDEELAKKIDTTMTKLAALTSDLDAGKGTVGKLLKDDTLYNNANHMLEETQGLIKAIRENPKKYLSIKLHVF
jgi:phospholipid/cholesterol/gamma-HCH transport system substrate-binding protein